MPPHMRNQELENRETVTPSKTSSSVFHENCESFFFVVVGSQLMKNPGAKQVPPLCCLCWGH